MAGPWVELRVHGVSGTPPGSMLDRPHVVQVGGDDESRYFRSQDAWGHELPGHDDQVLEAYHWGRLTSGSRVNALWLLLLPFGMVNAAHYMLPPPTEKDAAPGPRRRASRTSQVMLHATCDGFLRLIGLLLTSMYAFAFGLVFVDLIGWRWASQNALLNAHDPGWVVAPAAVLGAGGVVLLAFLARGYDETATTSVVPAGAAEDAAPPDRLTPLANEAFYSGDSRADELRDLHIAAGLLIIAMMAIWTTHPDAWESATGDAWLPDLPNGWTWSWLDGPRTLMYAVVLWWPVALLVLFFGDPERGTRTWSVAGQRWIGRSWSALTRMLAPALLGISVVVLALAVLASATGSIGWIEQQRPMSLDILANYLLFVGVGALVALVVFNALFVLLGGFHRAPAGSAERYFEPYVFGHATAVVALTGTFIGVGLAAAITTGVSSLLGLSEPAAPESAPAAEVTVGTTPMLDRVAYAWGVNAILLLVLLLVAVGLSVRPARRERRRQQVSDLYDVDGTSLLSARWAAKVRRGIWSARLKNSIGPLFVTFAAFGLLVSGVAAYELSGDCRDDSTQACREAWWPLSLLSQPKRTLADSTDAWTNTIGLVGAWLVLAVAGMLLIQGRKAFKTEDKRRSFNVIWDVLAFWPHAVHPFSPRPYSKRCVNDLRKRIDYHLRNTDSDAPRDLVLCGHSQGSLIGFATLLQLEPALRDRVAFVTFGSQLRVIFPRAFPAYVNYGVIRRLYDDLSGAWINLYRLTDPLAGPVLSWRHVVDSDSAARVPRSRHFPTPAAWQHPNWEPADEVDEFAEGDRRTLRRGADWQFADPVPADPDLNTGPVAELLRHSWFPRNPDWAVCLDEIRKIPAGTREPHVERVPARDSRLAAAGFELNEGDVELTLRDVSVKHLTAVLKDETTRIFDGAPEHDRVVYTLHVDDRVSSIAAEAAGFEKRQEVTVDGQRLSVLVCRRVQVAADGSSTAGATPPVGQAVAPTTDGNSAAPTP